ncbi:hypothetical protein DIPPA_24477 [Diplonema papillatum]|nr:hypothetical protein DIPPA_24477 [Diplonema papillatum]
MKESVAVIDAGTLGLHLTRELASRGFKVRLLCRKADATYGALNELGVDMTRVALVEGGHLQDIARTIGTADQRCTQRVVYSMAAASSEYCSQLQKVVEVSVKAGVKQLIVMSSAGTSRPWSLNALMANSKNLALGWQRRGEDCVRASGIDYVVVKVGCVSKRSGWRGILVRQGDVFGQVAVKKPGLHASAAAAVCAAATGLPGRKVTLEVIGDPDQPSCTDHGYSWSARLGALLDDDPWSPPDVDTLVAHDRAVLCCTILIVMVPVLACFCGFVVYSFLARSVTKPGLGSTSNIVSLALAGVGFGGTACCALIWRKTLFRGCCCCIPLAYSTKGSATVYSHLLTHDSDSVSSESEVAIQTC